MITLEYILIAGVNDDLNRLNFRFSCKSLKRQNKSDSLQQGGRS